MGSEHYKRSIFGGEQSLVVFIDRRQRSISAQNRQRVPSVNPASAWILSAPSSARDSGASAIGAPPASPPRASRLQSRGAPWPEGSAGCTRSPAGRRWIGMSPSARPPRLGSIRRARRSARWRWQTRAAGHRIRRGFSGLLREDVQDDQPLSGAGHVDHSGDAVAALHPHLSEFAFQGADVRHADMPGPKVSISSDTRMKRARMSAGIYRSSASAPGIRLTVQGVSLSRSCDDWGFGYRLGGVVEAIVYPSRASAVRDRVDASRDAVRCRLSEHAEHDERVKRSQSVPARA